MAEVFGIDVPDLPEHFIATDVLIMVRGVSTKHTGGTTMCSRASSGLADWDIAGMAACVQGQAVKQYVDG